jgi:hypothetical protein
MKETVKSSKAEDGESIRKQKWNEIHWPLAGDLHHFQLQIGG